jgi:hypothetical protein
MDLTTFENYILVSVHPTTGKSITGLFYFGLVGALFADLYRNEKIKIGNEYIVVEDITSVDIPVVDFVLHKIKTSKEYKKIGYWLPQLAGNKKFNAMMLDYLQEKQLIEIETHNVFFYTYKRYNIKDIALRKQLLQELHLNALSQNPDNLLLGLMLSTNLKGLLSVQTADLKTIKESCIKVQKDNIVVSLIAKVIHKQKLIDLWIGLFIVIWILLIIMGTHK